MTEELTYTFRFGIRGRTVEEDHITSKQVPFAELLDRFEQAHEWVMANPEKRYASVYGPGMMSRNVDWTTRNYIVQHLTENMPKTKLVIGLAWLDFAGKPLPGYELVKVYRTSTPHLTSPETEEVEYGLLDIAPEDWAKAFEWAKYNRWDDHGVWFNGKPGLIFCTDLAQVEAAFEKMPAMAKFLEPTGKLEKAPIRYGWADYIDAYPKMRPTRSTPQIQKLRSRYPTAGDDLLVTPLEILINKYGYSKVRS